MLTVVAWKWKPRRAYRKAFGPETVNVLRRMVARNYPHPHKFVCVTDDADGIDPDIRIVPLWEQHAELTNPHNIAGPSCYRRLRAFSAEAREMFGPRFVSLDLDTVVTGDLTPVWNRPEDFVIWGDTARGTPYNGSMFLLTAGARERVWTEFDPVKAQRETKRLRYVGSDQAWIGVCLGPNEKKWSKEDGVYSFRNQIAPYGSALPEGARVVMFHGSSDPWGVETQERYPWVKQHWR